MLISLFRVFVLLLLPLSILAQETNKSLPTLPTISGTCAGATALPCGTTNLAGTTNGSTNIAHGTGCTMSNYGVWYTFTGDGAQTTISIDAGSGYDPEMAIVSGSCGSLTNVTCEDVSGTGGIESYTFSSTNAVTYYVYIAHWSSGSTATGDFTISRSCVSPPANDDCASATSLPCSTTNLGGTTVGATSAAHGTGCAMSNYGVWYEFTGDGHETTISLSSIAGFDPEMAIASGSCGSLTNVSCTNSAGDESYTFTPANGTQYYVYIADEGAASTTTGTFDISRTCLTPTNTCSGNIYDSGGSGGNYGNNEDNVEVYCSSSGNCINMAFNSFALEDGFDFLEVFLGEGTNNGSTRYGLFTGTQLAGDTIQSLDGCITLHFVSDGSTTAAGYDISVSCDACPSVGPCGTPENNDYCADPALLTQGGSGWSSSTTEIYTAYEPNTLAQDIFCGSLENNSWYQFTAQNTTETFSFTSVNNCSNGGGIQAEVYSVTKDGNGCCTGLSSVSNCMSNGAPSAGVVTATGLTVGQDYLLMVDGFAGDNCDFTVSNWSASGILPVTLTKFNGYKYTDHSNKLEWVTETELNNDYFIVQSSANAKNFKDLGIVDGHGTKNTPTSYEFVDENPYDITYYRLKQIDYDGSYEYSKIIALRDEGENRISFYPNPTLGNLTIDFNLTQEGNYRIEVYDLTKSIYSAPLQIRKGHRSINIQDFEKLSQGVYFVKVVNEKGDLLKVEKIIKK